MDLVQIFKNRTPNEIAQIEINTNQPNLFEKYFTYKVFKDPAHPKSTPENWVEVCELEMDGFKAIWIGKALREIPNTRPEVLKRLTDVFLATHMDQELKIHNLSRLWIKKYSKMITDALA